MSPRTMQWAWSVLAALGFALAASSLIWSSSRPVFGAGVLLALVAGLMRERVAQGATLEQARMCAELIREGVQDTPLEFHGRTLEGVTVSSSVAVAPDHGTSWDALLRAADAALYAAKSGSRNQTRLAGHELGAAIDERPLDGRSQRALQAGEI